MTMPAPTFSELSGLSGAAPSTCAGALVDRQRERLHRHEALAEIEKVGRGRGEERLAERRCAESRADRPAQDEPSIGLHAQGELAVQRPAEVAVILRSRRDTDSQPPDQIPLDVHVTGDAVPGLVDLIRGPEAREDLRADSRPAAELVRHTAVAVRVRLARTNLDSSRDGTRRPWRRSAGRARTAKRRSARLMSTLATI